MVEAIAFDTHRFVKRLTENGFTEQQAETLAEEHVALLNSNLATKADIEALRQATKTDVADIKADIEAQRLATKADMAEIRADIEALKLSTKSDMEALRQESRASIETVKSDLLKWMFGALIAQGGLIVALVKLL